MMSSSSSSSPAFNLVTSLPGPSVIPSSLPSHPNNVAVGPIKDCVLTLPALKNTSSLSSSFASSVNPQPTIITSTNNLKKNGNLKRSASKISVHESETSLVNSTSSGDLIRLDTSSDTNNNNNNISSTTAGGLSLPPLRRDGQDLTEKKLRRLEKNRISARECRRKKREAAQNMEREINILESENLRLRLQLQIGDEAEESIQHEQERVTEQLDLLLKSGASESEMYQQIEFFKEKFADYGRDRRSAIEFHLKNVQRLLMPTSTTSVAIRALSGGIFGDGSAQQYHYPQQQQQSPSSSLDMASSSSLLLSSPSSQSSNVSSDPITTTNTNQPLPLEPKTLFHYLVQYLEVTPEQAIELKDSRQVAKELDSVLAEVMNVLQQLRQLLTQCNEDLEHEFSNVRSILTPTQAAKFLVWVANNSACMHMLNELWSKVYQSESFTTNDKK